MRKSLLFLLSFSLATTLVANQKYEVTPFVGYNLAEGNINVDDYLIYGASITFNDLLLQKFKPQFSFIYGSSSYNEPQLLEGKDTDIIRIEIDGVYEILRYKKLLQPYLKAGLGYESFSECYSSKNTDSAYGDVGAGVGIALSPSFTLKVESLYYLKYNATRWDNNVALTVGLGYSFGGSTVDVIEQTIGEESEENVAIITTDETQEDLFADSDNDGVLDSKDKCPHTPVGVVIDSFGCELDDDGDGIANSKDKCPNTPKGASVDSYGCQFDTDGDGVYDFYDKCPNTLEGVVVGKDGCMLDDDGDGVANAVDKCPNTPKGVKSVDIDGCIEKLNLQINFQPNSTKVDRGSLKRIKEFAKFLKENPVFDVTIVGYTDNTGSAKINKRLSQKRADAVKALLIQEGVNPQHIKAIGKGEANPIASNATKEGRAKNRRIEAELHQR